MLSDPIDFPLTPLADLAVTIHFAGTATDVTGHPGARCTSYLQVGDAVTAPTLPAAATMAHWYILSGIDVTAGKFAGAVAILGDSITDGRGSTTDGNGRWPDALARRLQADKRTAEIAVLNQGIGGNRALNDGLGPSALAREDRDDMAQSGVRWLIVLEGINDLGTNAPGTRDTTAQDLIAALLRIGLFQPGPRGPTARRSMLGFEPAAYSMP